MKKFLMVMVLMMANMFAYAGNSQSEELGGVIPLNVSTGMWRLNLTYDKNQNLIVCQRIHRYLWKNDTCLDENGKNAWTTMEKAVPKGKEFVGFKSVNQGDGHYIEIYWKEKKQ